ncbi:MAG: S-adenosyl-l-methionine hydroxide adenosyltransferase family protein [Nitrospiria bacterium]
MKSSILVSRNKSSTRGERPLITLTTDFGLRDYFVGAVKGVLLQKMPSARIVDITHDLPRHDIISGAYVINEAYRYFPRGSIHFVVVDPGVGTRRRKLVVSYHHHYFISPDNGILTYILEQDESRVFHIQRTDCSLLDESPTFAGRDLFAPIAAALAKGMSPEYLGEEIKDSYKLNGLLYEKKEDGLIGRIVYIDQYGNAITNLTDSCLREKLSKREEFYAEIKGEMYRGIKKNYEEGEKGGNLLINSSGHLEIFSPNASAKQCLNLSLLDEVVIP